MNIVFSLDTFFYVFQAPQQLFDCQMVQVNLTLNAVDCSSFTQASTLMQLLFSVSAHFLVKLITPVTAEVGHDSFMLITLYRFIEKRSKEIIL